jgi:hypothetical protein
VSSLTAAGCSALAEGEGDFFFDQDSLQVAPGVNVQSLLTQTAAAAAGMEHFGEEYDVDEEEEEDDDQEEDGDLQAGREERPTAGLEVVGHRVPAAAISHSSSAAMEQEEAAEDEAVIAEHRDT